jgi:hypothetical protein
MPVVSKIAAQAPARIRWMIATDRCFDRREVQPAFFILMPQLQENPCSHPTLETACNTVTGSGPRHRIGPENVTRPFAAYLRNAGLTFDPWM